MQIMVIMNILLHHITVHITLHQSTVNNLHTHKVEMSTVYAAVLVWVFCSGPQHSA